MSIEVTTPLIHKSLSTFLLSITPGASIYDNPNQQCTKIPAWFIIHRSPVSIVREIGRTWLTYEIDLFYMLELNLPNTFDQYAAIADSLNTSFEYLTIFGTTSKIHVLERNWALQLDCLKYSITLKLRVSRDTVLCEKMRVIEDLQVFLKNQPVEPTRYDVVIEPAENGYVLSNVSTAVAGNNVVLTVYPDTGYSLSNLVVLSGEETIDTVKVDDDYWFTMPDGAVNVFSTFTLGPGPEPPKPFDAQGVTGTFQLWGDSPTTGIEFGTFTYGKDSLGIEATSQQSAALPVSQFNSFIMPSTLVQ